jgi:hypothetical protein
MFLIRLIYIFSYSTGFLFEFGRSKYVFELLSCIKRWDQPLDLVTFDLVCGLSLCRSGMQPKVAKISRLDDVPLSDPAE